MIAQLNTYDWREAFGYCGEPNACAMDIHIHAASPGSAISTASFTRADVVEIRHAIEGENDGPPWRMVGKLLDGRWFYLEAMCDYTGWDCQAGGHAAVADSYDSIMRFGCTDEARELFGVAHP